MNKLLSALLGAASLLATGASANTITVTGAYSGYLDGPGTS